MKWTRWSRWTRWNKWTRWSRWSKKRPNSSWMKYFISKMWNTSFIHQSEVVHWSSSRMKDTSLKPDLWDRGMTIDVNVFEKKKRSDRPWCGHWGYSIPYGHWRVKVPSHEVPNKCYSVQKIVTKWQLYTCHIVAKKVHDLQSEFTICDICDIHVAFLFSSLIGWFFVTNRK